MAQDVIDLSLYRADFPMLTQKPHGKPLVYLDSGATAQKPQVVIDAITDFYSSHYGTVNRAVYSLATHSTEAYSQSREKARGFLNASKVEEIIFTRGTTESINLVAYSFGKAFVKPGDEILITEMEHHSNIVPWQILCEDRQAILKVVPVLDNGELDFEAYKRLLSDKTKLVACMHVSNVLGTTNPIREMVQLAHSAGAKFLVDGAQAAPHMSVDVQDLNCDFYVFSGHKAYGPTGIGVLYGREELLDAMPPYQGGGDMIETVTFEKTTYNHLPLKFEAGTPMIAEVIGLGAAIDYLTDIGLGSIHDWELSLLHRATQQLQEIEGLRIVGTSSTKGAIISFVVDGAHPLDMGTLLDLKGICLRTGHHCAQPLLARFGFTSTSRATFGLYNNSEDVDIFVTALKETLTQLR